MTLLEWTRLKRGRVAKLGKAVSHETVRRVLHEGHIPTRKTARLLSEVTGGDVSVSEVLGLTEGDMLDSTGTD